MASKDEQESGVYCMYGGPCNSCHNRVQKSFGSKGMELFASDAYYIRDRYIASASVKRYGIIGILADTRNFVSKGKLLEKRQIRQLKKSLSY